MTQRLKQLQKKYDKVCERLEKLNDQAFELEKEIAIEERKVNTPINPGDI